MPNFSRESLDKLATCDVRLQRLFAEVIKHFDCKVTCGHRGREEQEAAFKAGWSKARFGQSKHNTMPSLAADVVPFPVDYKDRERMTYFAGFVQGIAAAQTDGTWTIRWGGDWDRDTEVADNTFDDMPHFEIKELS